MYLTNDDLKKLGEQYFDVTIYRYDCEDVWQSILVYGTIEEIVSSMDAIWLLRYAPDADWDDFHAAIDLHGIDLVHMDCLSNPNYESFDVDDDLYDELMSMTA